MKQFIKASIMVLLAIVLQASSTESFAGDKWKVTEIKTNGPLKLTGDDWLFKIKIKNTGDKRTKGDQITVTMKYYGEGRLLGTKEITIQPEQTNSGDTFSFDLGDTATHEFTNGMVYEKIVGVIQDNSSLDGMSETFNVQSKGR
jgi:hypothetical protein